MFVSFLPNVKNISENWKLHNFDMEEINKFAKTFSCTPDSKFKKFIAGSLESAISSKLGARRLS